MKRTPLSLLRFTLRTVPAAAAGLLCLAPALHAADRFWIGTAGGAFGSTGNWSATDGGSGGASVPGAADVANFTLNNTYTVTFGAAVTLNALDAGHGCDVSLRGQEASDQLQDVVACCGHQRPPDRPGRSGTLPF